MKYAARPETIAAAKFNVTELCEWRKYQATCLLMSPLPILLTRIPVEKVLIRSLRCLRPELPLLGTHPRQRRQLQLNYVVVFETPLESKTELDICRHVDQHPILLLE
jgi:hypothetical protein